MRDAFGAFHAACASAGGSGCDAARKLYLDDLALPTNPDREVCAPLAPLVRVDLIN